MSANFLLMGLAGYEVLRVRALALAEAGRLDQKTAATISAEKNDVIA